MCHVGDIVRSGFICPIHRLTAEHRRNEVHTSVGSVPTFLWYGVTLVHAILLWDCGLKLTKRLRYRGLLGGQLGRYVAIVPVLFAPALCGSDAMCVPVYQPA
ncbi:hypothetical protein J6590_017440 [Homalodisca vitripennis]|nr:hypothetical protein J6590_017440 [Homalodisca vitripennis]